MKRFTAMLCAVILPVCAWAQEAAEITSDSALVAKSNNAFAADLYGQLRSQSGNLFFSPESISTALAMTYAGARGDTAAEMAQALHFTLPQERLHPAMAGLIKALNAGGEAHGYQLTVANALWAQEGYPFANDFLTITKDDYGAGLTPLDFKAAEAARTTINKWVEDKTKGKITDLIPGGVLSAATRLVLTNAVYFKGSWEKPFNKALTHDEDFHVGAGQTVQAPLMHITSGFAYADRDLFQVLELPYAGKDLSMVVFLPKDADGISNFEQSLSQDVIDQSLAALQQKEKVEVFLPKFKATAQFELSSTLGALGMRQAFDSHVADFSGMTGNKELFISNVIHKAYVDVNEEGTEAAAATAIVAVAALARRVEEAPPVFRADHPFVFIIRDNPSGSILFMGRMSNPS